MRGPCEDEDDHQRSGEEDVQGKDGEGVRDRNAESFPRSGGILVVVGFLILLRRLARADPICEDGGCDREAQWKQANGRDDAVGEGAVRNEKGECRQVR